VGQRTAESELTKAVKGPLKKQRRKINFSKKESEVREQKTLDQVRKQVRGSQNEWGGHDPPTNLWPEYNGGKQKRRAHKEFGERGCASNPLVSTAG